MVLFVERLERVLLEILPNDTISPVSTIHTKLNVRMHNFCDSCNKVRKKVNNLMLFPWFDYRVSGCLPCSKVLLSTPWGSSNCLGKSRFKSTLLPLFLPVGRSPKLNNPNPNPLEHPRLGIEMYYLLKTKYHIWCNRHSQSIVFTDSFLKKLL